MSLHLNLSRLAWEAQVRAARECPKAFARFVGQTKDKKPWKVESFHDEWQDFWTRHKKGALEAPIEHGKTEQMLMRFLWELGRDPRKSCAICCEDQTSAAERTAALQRWIEGGVTDADDIDRLHEVFPDLRPGKPWNTDGWSIKGHSGSSKDLSMVPLGIGSKITGKRLDILGIDDPHSVKNTMTADQRKKVIDWFDNEAYGRISADGCLWVIHTAWHPTEDLYSTLQARGFPTRKYRGVDPDWKNPLWPERWPVERLRKLQADIGALAFSRQIFNEAYDESTSRFTNASFELALAAGRDLGGPVFRTDYGEHIIVGVDLGIIEDKNHDRSSFAIVRRRNDGVRELLNVESGNWGGPEIVKRIDEIRERYGAPIFWVESVQAQTYILQFARHLTAALVRPHCTGSRYKSMVFSIEVLATEMEQGKWIIASKDGKNPPNDSIRNFIEGAKAFVPGQHPADELASVAIAGQHVDIGLRKNRTQSNLLMVV